MENDQLSERVGRLTDELKRQAEQFPAIIQRVRDIKQALVARRKARATEEAAAIHPASAESAQD